MKDCSRSAMRKAWSFVLAEIPGHPAIQPKIWTAHRKQPSPFALCPISHRRSLTSHLLSHIDAYIQPSRLVLPQSNPAHTGPEQRPWIVIHDTSLPPDREHRCSARSDLPRRYRSRGRIANSDRSTERAIARDWPELLRPRYAHLAQVLLRRPRRR